MRLTEEEVVELTQYPRPEPGSPRPVVAAEEGHVVVGYWSARGGGSSGSYVCAEFIGVLSHILGYPNDEALSSHPLYAKGLAAYSAFEVLGSSWLTRVVAMNRAHPYHDPKLFDALRHYVWTFHDSTFECLAQEVRISIGPQRLEELCAAWQLRLDENPRA